MPNRSMQVTGFVLAGGASRRMGQPKDRLVLGTETMLGRQSRLLHHICGRVAVVGRSNASESAFETAAPGYDINFLPDAFPGRGPLAGIYTALSWTRTEFNLVVGCDLPFMNVSFLKYLVRCSLDANAEVTVPKSLHGAYESLCAIYRRRLLPLIRTRVASGKNRISSLFPFAVCRVLSWPEIARAGFHPSIFANMNAPEEYELAKRRLESCASSGARIP